MYVHILLYKVGNKLNIINNIIKHMPVKYIIVLDLLSLSTPYYYNVRNWDFQYWPKYRIAVFDHLNGDLKYRF